MALSRINALFPSQKYLNRINQWLAEGIDIDADGQFTERSTSVYSPLTDRCLMTIARLTGKEELYKPVRKNLDLTRYFIHPNGEVATEVSRRQDQYRAASPAAYYYPCKYMAQLDNNPSLAGMARFIEDGLGATALSNNLIYFLEIPELITTQPIEALPTDYKKYFSVSGLVRIRRGNWDASILAKNPALVTYHHGTAVLQAVRMSSAFFGKGQFIADEMKVDDTRIILTQKMLGPYYQPITEELIDPEGDWEKMPKDQRPQSEVQEMEYSLVVGEMEGGITLEFEAKGTDNVPLAIELSFRAGGKLSNVKLVDEKEERYLASEDSFVYQLGQDQMMISGSRSDHAWTQLRGALPKIDGMSVYLTGYTPFNQKIKIEKLESQMG
jgi:hypothetical protein